MAKTEFVLSCFSGRSYHSCFFCALCDLPTDVWNHIHEVLLPKYSQQLNGVNVMSGPIFDKDFDGNVDPLEESSG